MYKSALISIIFIIVSATNVNANQFITPGVGEIATTLQVVKPDFVSMEEGRYSITPYGFKKFCRNEQAYCSQLRRTRGNKPQRVALSDERLAELAEVNRSVNRRIAPMPEISFFTRSNVDDWKLPTTSGDCEDYVLLKQSQLIEKGWPKNALLITIADNAKGYRHAVLTVRTDAGDFILDNENNDVKDWRDVNFRWIKRQSARNMMRWVEIRPESGAGA